MGFFDEIKREMKKAAIEGMRGKPLDDDEDIDSLDFGAEFVKEAVKSAKEDSSPPPREETAGSFCSECGTKLNAGAAFCSKCGTKVASDEEEESDEDYEKDDEEDNNEEDDDDEVSLGEEKKSEVNMKDIDGIAVVKSDQKWLICGNRKSVIQLLENIRTIVNEEEKRKYNLKVTGYIEKQTQMYPSLTQLADISIQIGQFISLNDRFDGIGIQNSYSILQATFDQETGSEEWSSGEITFPIYEILNMPGNKNFNVMEPFEKVIDRWTNKIINNINDNVIFGRRKNSISIVGSNSRLEKFLFNDIDRIISPFKNVASINTSKDENVCNISILLPTEIHIPIESFIQGDNEPCDKFLVGYFNFDRNNEMKGMNRIYFEFNIMKLAFNGDNKIIDIAEGNLDIGNTIFNELMKYI